MILSSALSSYSLLIRKKYLEPHPGWADYSLSRVSSCTGNSFVVQVSIFAFAFVAVSPGDFFQEMRLNPQISENTVYGFRTQAWHG
jgi:hypothetical protein